MANNSTSTYHSHSIKILSVCPFSHTVQFFPCGWVLNTFENMVASNTVFKFPFSIHTLSELAYAMHALKAQWLRHSIKCYVISTSHTTLNFANIKLQPFCQMPAKFFRYTVYKMLSMMKLNCYFMTIDTRLQQVSAVATPWWSQHDQTLPLSVKGIACETRFQSSMSFCHHLWLRN